MTAESDRHSFVCGPHLSPGSGTDRNGRESWVTRGPSARGLRLMSVFYYGEWGREYPRTDRRLPSIVEHSFIPSIVEYSFISKLFINNSLNDIRPVARSRPISKHFSFSVLRTGTPRR